MGCHSWHIHCRVSAICIIVCSVCCFSLRFHPVQGFLVASNSLVKDHLEANGQVEAIGHIVKRELPEFSSADARDVSQVSVIESLSTPTVGSFFQSDLSGTDPTQHQHNGMDLKQSLLHKLFNKYGENGVMTFDGFEQLLKNIGLLKFEVKNDDISSKNITLTVKNGLTSNSTLDARFEGGLAHHHDNDSSNKRLDNEMNAESDAADPMLRSLSQNNTGAAEENATSFNECMSSNQILYSNGLNNRQQLTLSDFEKICPTLVYILDTHVCDSKVHGHQDHDPAVHCHEHQIVHSAGVNETDQSWKWPSAAVWGFSFLACLVISAIGLVAVAIIPIMHQVIYNHLLQFFVALAIGSLSGDALLHLLPHAVMPHVHDHKELHSNGTSHELEYEIHVHDAYSQRRTVWCGLTALAGILLFFIVERVVGFCSERRRVKNDSEKHDFDFSKVSLAPVDERNSRSVKVNHNSGNSCEEMMMMVHSNKEVRKLADDAHDELHKNCDGIVPASDTNWGHTHVSGGHHHSHDVPKSVAAVAWVVIFGDGLHNFADGLAIGSAFANSLTGGLSTSIAVICHELPHELGDFAMLLKAGMSAKKALVYNCVSSILCVFGVILGVAIGNIAFVNPWIFSIIAGMFLYIALVDMLPEIKLVDPRKGEHPLVHFALQLMGMLTGSGIMLLIALYEDRLHLE